MGAGAARRAWDWKRWLVLLAVAAACCMTPLHGQGAQPPTAPTGAAGFSVTGRVLLADTQQAARFAQVALIPAAEDGDEGRGRRFSGRTDLEGAFLIPNVPPGDYYVTGQLAGYVNDASRVQAAVSAGGDLSTVLASVPKITVGAGGATSALTLQRGAVLAGIISWDDGSPAGGVQVSAQPAPATALGGTSATQPQSAQGAFSAGFGGAGTQSDDRGHFRIAGLAPGSYLVRASVQAPVPQADDRGYGRTLSLPVYAPDKMRRTDASILTLTAGEERDDVAVTMGLSGLHTVSGTVSATGAAVRSGSVTVTDQTDSTLNRNGVVNADGSFAVPYVPAGTYTLRVNASSQPAQGGFGRGQAPSPGGVSFQPLQVSITVADGDLTGLSLNVTTSANSP